MTNEEVLQYFIAKGYPEHIAAGIVGNLGQESSLAPNAVNPESGAIGLAQWLGPRKEALMAYAAGRGTHYLDPNTQLDFIDHELNTTESKARNALMKTQTPAEAATVFSNEFERAGASEKNNPRRVSMAERAFNVINPISSANASEDGPIASEEEWMATKHAMAAPIVSEEEWMARKHASESTGRSWGPTEEQKFSFPNFIRGVGGRAISRASALNDLLGNPVGAVLESVGIPDKKIGLTPEEIQWQKEHASSGAKLGNTAFDIGLTLPAGGFASIPARAAATAAIEGATTPGGVTDRLTAAALGGAGSVGGELVGKAFGTMLKPFSKTLKPEAERLLNVARSNNIPLSAADVTGNRFLKGLESVLPDLPSSSSAAIATKEVQREAWKKAIFREGDHIYDPNINNLGVMKTRLNAAYTDLSGRNSLQVDRTFKSKLRDVADNQLRRVPTNQKAVVQSYLDDFNSAPLGARIDGTVYQDTRSMLDRQAKSFKNSDPATAHALANIRDSLDSAMERGLNPVDKAAWRNTNKDYMVMKNIEKATDPVTGEVSPAKLVTSLTQRDPNIMKYGRGPQQLADLAKVGKQVISETTPNSGTPLRSLAMKLATGTVSPITFAGGLVGGVPGAALGMATNVLLPKAANKLMAKETGYLAKGLWDTSRPLVVGGTIQDIIDQYFRNIGVQVGREAYDTSNNRQ